MATRAGLVEYYRQGTSTAIRGYERATGRKIGMQELKDSRIQRAIAAHPHIERMTLGVPERFVERVDLKAVDPRSIEMAQQLLLAGRVLGEGAFAGDASRIKKAPDSNPSARYVMHESKIFIGAQQLIDQAIEAKLIDKVDADKRDASAYMPYGLGSLHLYKAAFEVYSLALSKGKTPEEAREILRNQVRVIVLPEAYADEAIAEVAKNNYYGFNPENMFFMIQAKLPGLNINESGEVVVDKSAPKRIWNHGAMKGQYAVSGEVFRAFVAESGGVNRKPISDKELDSILERMYDTVSYSIEDMSLIETGQVSDLTMIGLAYAHKLSSNAQFLMEVVAQNMRDPQKGGFVAFDPEAAEALMLETSMAGSLIDLSMTGEELKAQLRKIEYLNRNFNHTMDVAGVVKRIRDMLNMAIEGTLSGMPLEQRILGFPHPELKDGYLYPQPPQGDLNMALRKVLAAKNPLPQISGLKVQSNIPSALTALYIGSRQNGLSQFIEDVLSRRI